MLSLYWPYVFFYKNLTKKGTNFKFFKIYPYKLVPKNEAYGYISKKNDNRYLKVHRKV